MAVKPLAGFQNASLLQLMSQSVFGESGLYNVSSVQSVRFSVALALRSGQLKIKNSRVHTVRSDDRLLNHLRPSR